MWKAPVSAHAEPWRQETDKSGATRLSSPRRVRRQLCACALLGRVAARALATAGARRRARRCRRLARH